MTAAATGPENSLPDFPARFEHWDAQGQPCAGGAGAAGVVLICEHASNDLPRDWPALGGDLGIDAATHASHAAWDIGALGLARALAPHLARARGGAVLAHAPLSRLVCDLNRAPDHPQCMPEVSEIHAVPGNRALTLAQRQARIRHVRHPYHHALAACIDDLVLQGRRPVLVAVHSFTPVYMGQPRAVEFGILFDRDEAMARAILTHAGGLGLLTRLNEPYDARGAVAHTIRLHADPLRLRNTMLEIRNDLITTPEQQHAMGERLGPVLAAALHQETP